MSGLVLLIFRGINVMGDTYNILYMSEMNKALTTFHFKTCSVRIQGDLFDVIIPHKCGDQGEYLETWAYTTLNEV